jgi:histidine triad (HIT) family protein
MKAEAKAESQEPLFAGSRFSGADPMACLFCRIIAGEVPSKVVHSDERIVAIRDVNPQAPFHVLVLPRKHVATLNDLSPEDDGLVGGMVRAGARLAQEHGYGARGFRTVFNCNADAGQSVPHIHLHVLAGRRLGWPPG